MSLGIFAAPNDPDGSPALFPGTGISLAVSGLCHLNARVATSPMILASCCSETSPGRGTVSRPVPQTDEYASKESTLYVPSLQRAANTGSSRGGSIRPEYPTCLIGSARTALVIIAATLIVPLEPKLEPLSFSIAAPIDES